MCLLSALLLSCKLSATVNENSLNLPVACNNITIHTLPSDYNYRATRCILKDYKGLMWFGTQNGLIRFDGVNLKAYEHTAEDPKSIRYNTVNAIFEDKNHNLWTGISHVLNLYDRLHDNFNTIYSGTGQEHTLDYTFISSLSAN